MILFKTAPSVLNKGLYQKGIPTMTIQSTPLYSMNVKAGTQLLEEITKAVQSVKSDAVKAPVKKHPHARPQAERKDNPFDLGGSGDMLGFMMGSMFLDMLFGMPMLSMLGEGSHGLAQVGMMNMLEDDRMRREKNKAHKEIMPMPRAASFDEVVMAAERSECLQAVAAQKNKMRQLVMLRQLMAMLMEQMNTAQDESDEGKGDGTDGLVVDVLREPKMARFKQNRQSMACIRTLFARQSTIVVPKMNAPRYAFAA